MIDHERDCQVFFKKNWEIIGQQIYLEICDANVHGGCQTSPYRLSEGGG